jgi:glycosyltransferase involved in cell wall biosynthesis
MMLSILIPTHNRPILFERCLKAILSQMTDNIEIIVNNDSDDIIEIRHPNVKYYYNQFDNLSQVYEFLLNQAQGEYVYYAEDDDYIVEDFTKIVLDADLIAGNYYPTYGQSNTLPCMQLYKNNILNTAEFIDSTDLFHLQLSQYIFKRSTIMDFKFPMDNNIHNDIKLVIHSASNASTIKTMNKVFFYQTIDGKDNISFPNLRSNG